MLSMALNEGGNSNMWWFILIALLIFGAMVVLGWLVSSKGWLKPEEELVQPHSHEAEGHAEAGHAEFAHLAAVAETPESVSDDLTRLEGIGPKVAKLLQGIGITTFAQLAEADLAKLRHVLDNAGYTYMEPAGWVEQAVLAARGDEEGLKKLQETLKGGRRVA